VQEVKRSGTTKANTAKTAEKGGQKNETEHCRNRDSPISPSDPQASTTISGGCPLTKKWSVSDFFIEVSGGRSSRE
jgi:hypothetical protein